MTLFERTNTFPTLAGMRGISRLHDDIDRLFGGFLAREPWPDFSASAPEDVKIEVNANELTISGEKKEEVKEDGKTHVQERRYGSFMRRVTLPEDADCDSIKAVSKNGVLTLEIARKAPEQGKVRSIEVQKD